MKLLFCALIFEVSVQWMICIFRGSHSGWGRPRVWQICCRRWV